MIVELIWLEQPITMDSEKWFPEGKVPKARMLDTFAKWCEGNYGDHSCIRVFTQSEYVRDCFRLLHIRGVCTLVIYYGEEKTEVNEFGQYCPPEDEGAYTSESLVREMIIEESSSWYAKIKGWEVEDDDTSD